jgi:hypothetical protein
MKNFKTNGFIIFNKFSINCKVDGKNKDDSNLDMIRTNELAMEIIDGTHEHNLLCKGRTLLLTKLNRNKDEKETIIDEGYFKIYVIEYTY